MSWNAKPRKHSSNGSGSGRADKSSRRYNGALSQWMAKISEIPLLTADEERTLARRVREGDDEALTQLVQANLRLVVRIASRYAHPNIPLIDLIQEGNIGLVQAAERFDPERGFRFSTYAVWWIRRAILRSLSYDSRIIRLPEHILADTSKLDRHAHALRQKLGREPRPDELARAMETSPDRVEFLTGVSYEYVSLDMEMPMPGQMSLGDVLEDERQRPERWWEQFLRREDVGRLLSVLSEREQAILRARFGLDDGRPRTLKETGQLFNLTRERIRQIEKQALAQLRETWAEPDRDGLGVELEPATA